MPVNWPLIIALSLAFAVVVGNILLLKHTARLQISPFKQLSGKNAKLDLTDSVKDSRTHSDSLPVRSKAE